MADDEWFTPKEYVEMARQVMGSIDLDPASTEFANRIVGATEWRGEWHGGHVLGSLEGEWRGNVWLNPPYGMWLIKLFVHKVLEEVNSCNVNQAVVLVNSSTETGWFRLLEDSAHAVCFKTGRIAFYKEKDGKVFKPKSPRYGNAFFYFGDAAGTERFEYVFSEIGRVYRR